MSTMSLMTMLVMNQKVAETLTNNILYIIINSEFLRLLSDSKTSEAKII